MSTEVSLVLSLLAQAGFPDELVINYDLPAFTHFLASKETARNAVRH